MNEISIPTRTSRDIVTLPTVPEHYIEMGIALPSIAQASPAVKNLSLMRWNPESAKPHRSSEKEYHKL